MDKDTITIDKDRLTQFMKGTKYDVAKAKLQGAEEFAMSLVKFMHNQSPDNSHLTEDDINMVLSFFSKGISTLDEVKSRVHCKDCKYLDFSDMYGECSRELKIVLPDDSCDYGEPKKKKCTNYERITRSMSDLASQLRCPYNKEYHCRKSCHDCIMKWLKSESKY